MSRLHITLRVPCDLLNLSDCILECATSESESTDVLNATAHELIQDNDHSTVYRASLNDRSVILKFCLREQPLSDLELEANAYQNVLMKFQGTVVPRFYGFYKGYFRGRPMGCIILEDCGDSLDQCFDSLPWDDRRQILEKLGTMHFHGGYHPDDFSERNVVHKDGEYRLIDFHQLSQHPCGWDGDWRLNQHTPPSLEFHCDLLQCWGKEMELWSIGDYISVFGEQVLDLGQYPQQEIIDLLLPDPNDFVNILPNRADLINWLARVKVRMDAGEKDIEYLKQSMPEFTYGRAWLAHGQKGLRPHEILIY